MVQREDRQCCSVKNEEVCLKRAFYACAFARWALSCRNGLRYRDAQTKCHNHPLKRQGILIEEETVDCDRHAEVTARPTRLFAKQQLAGSSKYHI